MIRWIWRGVLAILLLLITASFLMAWTQASRWLNGVRLIPLMTAAGFYSTGFLIFSGIWSFLAAGEARYTSAGALISGYGRVFRISLMAIAGLLTPMNLGTDVLRSVLSKKYLSLDVSSTAASSVATRECKLHVTLFLILAVLCAAEGHIESPQGRLLVVLAGLMGFALVLFFLRSNGGRGLAKVFKLDRFSDTLRFLNRRIGWGMRLAFCCLFALGFAGEWQALCLCFQAVGLRPDPGVTFTGFGILYFLARTPALPLGVGLVETAGFAWFRAAEISAGQAGAVVILWGFLRIGVPYVLAAVAFMSLWLGRRSRGF